MPADYSRVVHNVGTHLIRLKPKTPLVNTLPFSCFSIVISNSEEELSFAFFSVSGTMGQFDSDSFDAYINQSTIHGLKYLGKGYLVAERIVWVMRD